MEILDRKKTDLSYLKFLRAEGGGEIQRDKNKKNFFQDEKDREGKEIILLLFVGLDMFVKIKKNFCFECQIVCD